MLKETLQQFQRVEASPDFEENSEAILKLFHGFLDYLEDGQRFPNRIINAMTIFVRQLIRDGHITVIFSEEKLNEHIALIIDFARGLEKDFEKPALYIPQNFINEVAKSPEEQIGLIVSAISQCRDYFCGKIDLQNSEKREGAEARALAHEAEALITLLKMAVREKISLNLSDFQMSLLKQYPNGLGNLSVEFWYPNPKYQKTFSPPPYNPSCN
jgi:hypothetical protein